MYTDLRQATLRTSGAVLLLALVSGCTTVQAPLGDRDVPSSVEARAPRSPLLEPPGALFADVTADNVSTTICVAGWTATVRPSTSYTQGVKLKLLREAGVDQALAANYELDHFVPLALGGHPRAPDNLWLQSWNGEWSARWKDRLERKLQVMVCAGQVTLRAARTAIQRNWKAAYRKYVAPSLARELDTGDEEVVE